MKIADAVRHLLPGGAGIARRGGRPQKPVTVGEPECRFPEAGRWDLRGVKSRYRRRPGAGRGSEDGRGLDSAPGIRHRAGSVLVLVLWSLVFVAALALAMASYVRAGITAADRVYRQVQAAGLARAAVERALAMTAADTNAWDATGEPWAAGSPCAEGQFETGSFSIYHTQTAGDGSVVTNSGLADEEQRIHVNRAPPDLLAALFEEAARLRPSDARALASAVVEWRTAPTNTSVTPARGQQPSAPAVAPPPHHADLDTAEELLFVPGMTAEVFDQIEPYVTVWGAGRVNANTAGVVVLTAVARWAGAGDRAIAQALARQLVTARQQGAVFRSKAEMIRWTASQPFTAGEREILRRMAEAMDVHSTCFRGVARGVSAGHPKSEARIAFVFEREHGRRLMWFEF